MDNLWIIEKLRQEELERERRQEQPQIRLPVYIPEDGYESTPEEVKEERGIVTIDI